MEVDIVVAIAEREMLSLDEIAVDFDVDRVVATESPYGVRRALG